jgi:HD-GYP domain-containing protein (c-di-GMP phosphodiesterase class II)
MNLLLEFLEFIEASAAAEPRELMARVLLKCRRLTGAQSGFIATLQRRGETLAYRATVIQSDKPGWQHPSGELVVQVGRNSISGYAAMTGKTVRVADVRAIPASRPYRLNAEGDRKLGFGAISILSLPLKNHAGEVIGVVQLVNRFDKDKGPLPFTAEHAKLITPINHFIGGAVERADLIQRLSERNRELQLRNRVLAAQRSQIAVLKDQTEEAFQLSIKLLARSAELYDEGTGHHIERVNEYSFLLAKQMGMPAEFCDEIHYSAQLHDIGKLSIDHAILKKRDRLSAAERAEMNRHPEYGYRILIQSDRLRMAADIARCHHEKWDGTGYPRGLKGRQIPVAARIVQLADIYDALRSTRPYKPGFSHEQARQVILQGDERINPAAQFAPDMLNLFADCHGEMERIWKRLVD